jgi:hypothetical protein
MKKKYTGFYGVLENNFVIIAGYDVKARELEVVPSFLKMKPYLHFRGSFCRCQSALIVPFTPEVR